MRLSFRFPTPNPHGYAVRRAGEARRGASGADPGADPEMT